LAKAKTLRKKAGKDKDRCEHRAPAFPSRRPLYTPDETHQMHLEFWNERRSRVLVGKVVAQSGRGHRLSYDMRSTSSSSASQDYGAFRDFGQCGGPEATGGELRHGGTLWIPTQV